MDLMKVARDSAMGALGGAFGNSTAFNNAKNLVRQGVPSSQAIARGEFSGAVAGGLLSGL